MTAALKPEHRFSSETLGEVEARVLFPEPRPSARDVRFVTLFRQAPLALELGGQLSPVRVAYSTYGKLNEAKRQRGARVSRAHGIVQRVVVVGRSAR
ncbi:MAG: hypothetical protein HC933_14050 [Pleurocapsa sp. SU_196_0]|nr:hypothetical protein [Pleurocapsa sp. SU_196_0]